TPVGFVAPDFARGRAQTVVPAEDPRVLLIPHSAMQDDLITDFDVRDTWADLINDAGSIGPSDMKSLGCTLTSPVRYDVKGITLRCPGVVVIHAGGHDGDEDLAGFRRGDIHYLRLEGANRGAKPFRTEGLRVHLARHNTDRRQFADVHDFQAPYCSTHIPGCPHQKQTPPRPTGPARANAKFVPERRFAGDPRAGGSPGTPQNGAVP